MTTPQLMILMATIIAAPRLSREDAKQAAVWLMVIAALIGFLSMVSDLSHLYTEFRLKLIGR